jgi:ParB family transcriptional regulator, chromosome partitioning protein
MSAIEQIAVGKLKLADDNVRSDVGDVSELVASIKAVGLIEPLIVNAADNVVVCGARRLVAAKKAGLKDVPAIVKPFTEQERIETMLIENLQREGLTPIEEANAYQRLVELGLTQREIAARVGRSQSAVAKRLSLLVLPEPVRKQVDSGGIKIEDAQELARLKDPKLISAVAKKSPGMIQHNVGTELAKLEREKKLATAVRALEKEKGKEKVVALTGDQYGQNIKAPKGMVPVIAESHWSFPDAIVMKAAEHGKLKCNLFAVHPRTFQTVAVCSDPKSHGPTAAETKKAANLKRDEEAKARQEAWQGITERRREFLKTLLVKPKPEVVLEFCYLALTSNFGYWHATDDLGLAVELLGIEPKIHKDEEDGEEWEVDADEQLAERAAKSAADRLRVTMAIAAAQLDEVVVKRRYDPEAGTPYLQQLVTLGYPASPDELALMQPEERRMSPEQKRQAEQIAADEARVNGKEEAA